MNIKGENTMRKLFLASSFTDVSSIFKKFENDLKGKRVTFIPTASIVEEVVFYVDEGKQELENLGLIVDELEISTASRDEIENKLKNNDFIYVTGGNTFFLLQELKRTGADKIIISEVQNGKVYIGESAGSIITSNNIEYVKGMDNIEKAPNLQEYSSLGLIDFYPAPHHNCYPFEKIVQKIIDNYDSKLNLLPISNTEAITVIDNNINKGSV